ncbi:MAG: cation:proton antiporter [Candidatus Nomurabacteria bacterium]
MQGFQELTLIILIASVVSVFIHYIRQPLIVGYVISGVLAGHYFFNIISNPGDLELFSKMGIVILLFTIGLNLNPGTLKEVGRDSSVGALLQVFVSSIFGFVLSHFILHFNVLTSVFVGVALAFSSTIVVMKILSDQGHTDKLFSKISVGILLIQDILSAILLVVLAMVNESNYGVVNAPRSALLATFAVKIIILLIIYFILRKFVLQKSIYFFSASQEALLLFGLSAGFTMAYLFYKFGLSLEIGALFAGVALSSSTFAKEISSRMKPIQDFFIAMFFVLLGANLIVDNLSGVVSQIFLLVLFVVVFKLVVVFLVMNFLGHRTRTSFYTAVSLTQLSEFSLIALTLISAMGLLDKNIVSIMTVVAMISIAISAYMMIYLDEVYVFLRKILKKLEIRKNNFSTLKTEAKDLDLVIFGFHRIGKELVYVFKRLNYKFLIIDLNPESVKDGIEMGGEAIYGDAEDFGFLEENHILESNTIISTIPSLKSNLFLVESYRKKNKEGRIVVVAHDFGQAKILYAAGATYVLIPYLFGAREAAEMLLKTRHNPEIFEQERELQFRSMQEISEEE